MTPKKQIIGPLTDLSEEELLDLGRQLFDGIAAQGQESENEKDTTSQQGDKK